MRFKLEMSCDNAAFDKLGEEIEAVLNRALIRAGIENGGDAGPLYDTNGNKVGSWRLEE